MVDISLNNGNIKKNLTKTKVSAKQKEVKAQETAKPAVVQTSAKTTAQQVVSGLADGTMSASKAVSTLQKSTPVKATKTGKLTTVTSKLDNKSVKIVTNVPITVSDGKIATAKSLDTGLTTKGGSTIKKPVTNDKTGEAGLKDKTVGNGKSRPTTKPIGIGTTLVDRIGGKSGKTDEILNVTSGSKNNSDDFEILYNACKDVLGNVSKEDFKCLYNVMKAFMTNKTPDANDINKAVELIINGIDMDAMAEILDAISKGNTDGKSNASSRNNAPARKTSSSSNKTGGDNKSWGDYYNDFINTWKESTGNKNITGQNFFQEDFLGYKAGDPMPMTNPGGACNNSGSQAAAVGGLGMLYATLNCIKDGIVKGTIALEQGLQTAFNNVLDKFTIYPNNNNGNNGGTTGSGKSGGTTGNGYGWGGSVPGGKGSGTTGSGIWSQGYIQYGGGFTVDTGKGTSVTFGDWTAIGVSDGESGYNGIFTDKNGNPVVVTGSNGNGDSNPDGIGNINNHEKGETWTDANGTEWTYNADGSLTGKYKNGVTITYNSDGSEVRTESDGSVTVTPPSSGGTSGSGGGYNPSGSGSGQSDSFTDTMSSLAGWASAGGNQSLADALNAWIAGGCQGNFHWDAGSGGSSGSGGYSGSGGGSGSVGGSGSSGGSSGYYYGQSDWSAGGSAASEGMGSSSTFGVENNYHGGSGSGGPGGPYSYGGHW